MVSPEQQARQEWAKALLGRATGPVPAYGTAEWLALPDGPAKVAAVVRAAECWAREADDLEARLRYELWWDWMREKRAQDAARIEQIEAHRAQWSGKDWRPHPANRPNRGAGAA